MPLEIERKFLVRDMSWGPAEASIPMRQGYLAVGPPVSVRVRIEGQEARLNLKRSTLALTREEYEYSIPVPEALELLDGLCGGRVLEKTRHIVHFAGKRWEVDVFEGRNAGLVLAELELTSEDEFFERPAWLGAEVSGDPRYLNSSLATHPYADWAATD
jgi:adenylate cyclase